jgi:CheY-specific phosphatase CheX
MHQTSLLLVDPENLRSYLSQQAIATFNVMLRMTLEPLDPGQPIAQPVEHLVGVVGFAGPKVAGTLALTVSPAHARSMAGSFLGFGPGESVDEAVVSDVLGEVGNMICGNLVSWLAKRSLDTELGLPTVTLSPKLHFKTAANALFERLCFLEGDHPVLLELQICAKPSPQT